MEQGALGAAGVRRVWAGAGLQRAAYRGGGILRGFSHNLLYMLRYHVIVLIDYAGRDFFRKLCLPCIIHCLQSESAII